MQSATKTSPITFSAVFAALGACIQMIENYIPYPFPLPGGKLGLSNVVTMVVLKLFGVKYALVVAILKSLLTILLAGRITGFVYSLAGGISAVIAMHFADKYIKGIGGAGCGILGAWANNIAQTAVGAFLMTNIHIMTYAWVLGPVSVVTGAFTGILSDFVGGKFAGWIKK